MPISPHHDHAITTPNSATLWSLWIEPSFGGKLRERERERERTKWLTKREKKIIQYATVNSTSKVSDGYIKDLGFNPAYIKNWLMSWFDDKELLLKADIIDWNSLEK